MCIYIYMYAESFLFQVHLFLCFGIALWTMTSRESLYCPRLSLPQHTDNCDKTQQAMSLYSGMLFPVLLDVFTYKEIKGLYYSNMIWLKAKGV